MDKTSDSIKTIDEYIQHFPQNVQDSLEKIRKVIKIESPEALEAISYGMPTFKLHGVNLVHFAAWKHHIGFYPTPSGTTQFRKELETYSYSKGAIQFLLTEKIPFDLIKRIVNFRVQEIKEKKKK